MFGMRTRNSRHSLVFTVAAMAAMSPLAIVAPAQAQEASDQQQTVNEAAATVTAIRLRARISTPNWPMPAR